MSINLKINNRCVAVKNNKNKNFLKINHPKVINSSECDRNKDLSYPVTSTLKANYRSRWQKRAVVTLISTFTLTLSQSAIVFSAPEVDAETKTVVANSLTRKKSPQFYQRR